MAYTVAGRVRGGGKKSRTLNGTGFVSWNVSISPFTASVAWMWKLWRELQGSGVREQRAATAQRTRAHLLIGRDSLTTGAVEIQN